MTEQLTVVPELVPFFHDDWITDVISVVKSGKEATVYCCKAHSRIGAELLAAKVYRTREHRNFHNNGVYLESREPRDKRLRRAVHNKSTTGMAYQAIDWVDQEFQTLKILHSAGANVPEPFVLMPSALLMEDVGDSESAAPPLRYARINADEAERLFVLLMDDVELWLAHNPVTCGLIGLQCIVLARQTQNHRFSAGSGSSIRQARIQFSAAGYREFQLRF